MQLHRFDEFSSRMRPASRVHHLRPAHRIVRGVSIALQKAIELLQETFRAFTPAPHAELEHHGPMRPPVLPQIRQMVAAPPIVHLYPDRGFIGLQLTSTE